jgi:hypothetical protein
LSASATLALVEVTFTKRDGGDHEIVATGRRSGPDVRHPRSETPSPMPHDLAHLAVESALGIDDGFWAAIDAGVTFGGFVPVERRRHATGGRKVLRKQGDAVMAAERIVSWSYRVWCGRSLDRAVVGDAPIDEARLQVALRALDEAGAAWAALEEGQALSRSW